MPLIWPPEINPPDPQGYKLIPVDTVARSDMGEGFQRTRRRSLTAPTRLECQWVLPSDQARLLTDFHRYALRRGADACTMPVWVHGAFHSQTVLFQGPPDDAYFSHTHSLMTAKFNIQDELGTSKWQDVLLTDIDVAASSPRVAALQVVNMTTDFRVNRVDIFVRTPPNSGTSDEIRVGWYVAGQSERLVEDISVTTAGHIIITASHANAGTDFGVLQTGGALPVIIQVQWISTGTAPTQCDMVVIIPVTES